MDGIAIKNSWCIILLLRYFFIIFDGLIGLDICDDAFVKVDMWIKIYLCCE